MSIVAAVAQVSAVWHNMREEPVIYINGRPFVLRVDERPFKNMQEYTGIDVRRLEQMELRLKNDILQVWPPEHLMQGFPPAHSVTLFSLAP